VDEIWSTEYIFGAGLGRFWARSATAGEPGEILFLFLSGKQRTILLISCRPNFTKFEHSTLIGVADENFQYKILKLLP